MSEKTPAERAREMLEEAAEIRRHAEALERAARALLEHEERAEGGATVHPIRPEDPGE